MQITRRRYPRARVTFQVRIIEASGTSWVGEGQALSPFGTKVSGGHVDLHALVQLELDLPAEGPHLEIRALAVRSEPDGVAFAFVDLARTQYHLIRQAVDSALLQRKLWIMIVDADRAAAAVLADYVEREGHAVLIIPTAEEALAYLAQDRVDAIMLDLDLPGMSGMQFLEALAERGLHIPIVVVSGATSEEDAVRYLQLGALDFVTKPLAESQIELTVSALSLKSLEGRLSG